MSPVVAFVLTLVFAYLVGAIPFGYLVAKWRGVDILRQGSGNIGATNVGRVLGRRFGILIFVLDFLKGAVPVVAARQFAAEFSELPPDSLPVAAGIAAFLGHLFPVYLHFRGGKGVATGAGAVVVLTPVPAALALLTWIAALIVTRYVSAASLLACLVLCVARLTLTPESWGRDHVVVTAFCFVAAALVFVRHQANIRRLVQGIENRLPESPAMLLFGKTIHVLALGLWFGTIVFFVVVGLQLFRHFEKEATNDENRPFAWVPRTARNDGSRPLTANEKVPDWMRKEPGTRAAGFAVSALFPWYFGIQHVCALLAAATSLTWVGANKGRVHRIRAIVLIAALVCVVGGGWLEGQVAEKTGPRNALTDVALQEPTKENIDKAEAARSEFWKLHGYSMLLNLVVLLLVTTAMALAAQLPTSTTAESEPSANGHAGLKQQVVSSTGAGPA